MFCENCGKELNDNVKFCGNCGARVKIEVENVVKTESEAVPEVVQEIVHENGKNKTRKKKCKMLIIGSIIIVLVIIAIIVCVLGILERRNYLDDSEITTLYIEKHYVNDETPMQHMEYQINENEKCVSVKWCNELGYEETRYIYIFNSNINIWEKLLEEENFYNWDGEVRERLEYVYEYDWLGRVSERSIWNRLDNVKEGHVKYKYQYNLKNQLTDVKIYDVETGKQLEWMKYHYDEDDRCIKREWGYTEAGYQELGKEGRNDSWEITQAVSVYEWEYDDDETIISITESKDFMNYDYGDTSTIIWDSDGKIQYYDVQLPVGSHRVSNYQYEGDTCISGWIDGVGYDEIEDYLEGRSTEVVDLGYLVYECEPWNEYTYPSEETIAKDLEENFAIGQSIFIKIQSGN